MTTMNRRSIFKAFGALPFAALSKTPSFKIVNPEYEKATHVWANKMFPATVIKGEITPAWNLGESEIPREFVGSTHRIGLIVTPVLKEGREVRGRIEGPSKHFVEVPYYLEA